MVSPFGSAIAKTNPRKTLRAAYRDWIRRQCLSSPVDLSITGVGAKHWHGTAGNQLSPTSFFDSFKTVEFNFDAKGTAIYMLDGNTGSTTYDHSRPLQVNIFCRDFKMTQGTMWGATYINDNRPTLQIAGAYSRGFSKHVSDVTRELASVTGVISGGSWGSGGGVSASHANIEHLSHYNAITEAQYFLTNEKARNTIGMVKNSTTDYTKGFPVPGSEFGDMYNGEFSYLVSAHGGPYLNGSTTHANTRVGGHIRIFALNSFTIEENGVMNIDDSIAAATTGGAGTLEIITNNFICNKTTIDEIRAKGGTTAAGSGGGGIFVYANNFSYDKLSDNLLTVAGANSDRGTWIDENDVVVRQSTHPSAGYARFYKIEEFDTDPSDLEFQ